MTPETQPRQQARSMRTLRSKSVDVAATVRRAAVGMAQPPMPTVPNQRVNVAPLQTPGVAPVQPRMRQPLPPQHRQKAANGRWWLWGLASVTVFVVMVCAAIGLGVMLVYENGILPGVSAAGMELGGKSEVEAQALLNARWELITLRDGLDNSRTWTLSPDDMGIRLDAAATAANAYAQGRGEGSIGDALFGRAEVAPTIEVDALILNARLEVLADQVRVPAKNAGVRFVNGQVEATVAVPGRALNIAATAARVMNSGRMDLADGVLELVMDPVQPTVTDATPILEAARTLLQNPLVVHVYDPVTGDIVNWTPAPDNWASWLMPTNAEDFTIQMGVDSALVRGFLADEARSLDATRYLNYDEAVAQIQAAVSVNDNRPVIRVYHRDRQHVVQAGESITSIAWDYGVPYPWVQQANPNVDALTIGQTITIPSPDNFLPFDVVPEKRIVVSISQQRTWVYENGALKWDWPASTGINSSPTWTGVYQIISHEPNAYAGNWDLWMPNFMGVYQPIPGQSFTNGFHGFPTRGGGQLLWENSLGTRVTYGCILLSNANVRLLYDWAEEGVVVEIQP